MTQVPQMAKDFMLPTSHFDSSKADFVVAFIEQLKHTKGDFYGKPFILLPWQRDLVRTIFGVIDSNGNRQCRTAYVIIGKKNGKTCLAAAIALYMLIADGEYGAEIYSAAADRAQAGLIYRESAAMVDQCPALRKRLKVLESQKRIIYSATKSFYQVLSSEAYSKHGISPSCVLYDELHVADRDMFQTMTHGASDARRQPLNIFITTAGNNLHSIGYETHQKALDIKNRRKIDPTFLPVIYAADEGDDWTDAKIWKKANPSLGVTIGYDKMKLACESALQNPAEENLFKQLRLCIWTKQFTRYIPMIEWNKCNFHVDADELLGRKCYAGLDLSSTTDITSLILLFPPDYEEDKWQILPFFWIPGDNIKQRVRKDKVPYDIWEKQGLLFTTEGNVLDYRFIEGFIKDIYSNYQIAELVYDRWQASELVRNLQDEGITVVPFGMGYSSMNQPTKDILRLVLGQKIAHGGNPVLTWMADNLTIKMDEAGNIKPDKAKSIERIDGMVALLMALGRATVNENTFSESIYNTEERSGGLFIL